MNNTLRIAGSMEDNTLSISSGERVLFAHRERCPCFELSVNRPDFRTHPRSIANYKLKNHVVTTKPLRRITRYEASDTGVCVDFDDCLRVHIVFEGTIANMTLTPLKEYDTTFNRFSLRMRAHKAEAVYGCGEQFSYLNLRGREVPMWTQEPGFAKNRSVYKLVGDLVMGAGGEWWTNYYPQALFVSSDNYFVSVESYAFANFDFRNPDYHRLSVNEIPQKIVFGFHDTTVGLLSILTQYLGRQRRLPDWIMDGAILGIGGGLDTTDLDSLVTKLERAQRADTKIAAVWAEDWTGLRHFKAQTRLFWNWKFSDERYSALPDYIADLKKQGIRFLGYNNCFLMYDSEMYDYAAAHNYLVLDRTGKPYDLPMFSFSAVMLDLTNPACREWITRYIVEHMIDIGIDGWMCDFAEYLPTDAVLASGADASVHHNEYPVAWAQVNADAVRLAGRDEGEDAVVFFSRSGNLGTTRHAPLIWTGDQTMTYWPDSGLPAAVNACVSMGFSGVGHIHADIAGEFGLLWFRRTKDLFLRSTEFAAFTPVMRTHEAKGTSGWTLDSDEETLAHFARFSRIHAALLPYLRECADEYQTQGLPMMRHPYIHYENDAVLHAQKPRLLQYEYLLGRDMLVAPVIKKNAVRRRVYLPHDRWTHLWSGQEYEGGWVAVDAPYGSPPVFVRNAAVHKDTLMRLRDM